MDGVERWLKDNLGVILGVCTGVAVVEVSLSLRLSSYCLLKAKLFFWVTDTWFNGSTVLARGHVHLELRAAAFVSWNKN